MLSRASRHHTLTRIAAQSLLLLRPAIDGMTIRNLISVLVNSKEEKKKKKKKKGEKEEEKKGKKEGKKEEKRKKKKEAKLNDA